MPNWMACPECNYLIVNPSLPCPSCGAVVSVSAMPDQNLSQNTSFYDDDTAASDGYLNNIFMWILAFISLAGRFIERYLLSGKYGDASDFSSRLTMTLNKYEFWYVTLILVLIALCLDLVMLKKAGYKIGKFGWLAALLLVNSVSLGRHWTAMASLAPAYIYLRTKESGQNQICFVVSVIVCILPVVAGYV